MQVGNPARAGPLTRGNKGGGRRLGTLNYVKWRSDNPLN